MGFVLTEGDLSDPFLLGHRAALRVGPYLGARDAPECPFEKDSVEDERWRGGFGEGTDLMEMLRDAE
jgi:hypothetical protein